MGFTSFPAKGREKGTSKNSIQETCHCEMGGEGQDPVQEDDSQSDIRGSEFRARCRASHHPQPRSKYGQDTPRVTHLFAMVAMLSCQPPEAEITDNIHEEGEIMRGAACSSHTVPRRSICSDGGVAFLLQTSCVHHI